MYTYTYVYCVSCRAAYRWHAHYSRRVRFSFTLLLLVVVVSYYCRLACSDVLTSPVVEAWWRRVCQGCESDAALSEMWAYAVKLADVPRIVVVSDLSFRRRWVQSVFWRRRPCVLPKRRCHNHTHTHTHTHIYIYIYIYIRMCICWYK
jgi:hypothetical protein